jgi:hypothetical protein
MDKHWMQCGKFGVYFKYLLNGKSLGKWGKVLIDWFMALVLPRHFRYVAFWPSTGCW